MHLNHMCMSTSGKIACCIIQTFMLHKNACQHQFKLHVAKKSMSTSSKIACCIIQDMHVAKTSMSTWIEITCCKIQDMHVATSRMSTSIEIACCKKKHVNMNSTCMLHNSRHACCANQDEKNHVAFTCAHMSRAERVVYWYTFSNPHTNPLRWWELLQEHEILSYVVFTCQHAYSTVHVACCDIFACRLYMLHVVIFACRCCL